VSAPIQFKYRAFLSYAHADVRWGKWLHGQLEKYRIGKDLAGRETPLGSVPATLRPIFRDREDFTGGHTLQDATIAALGQSAALIVLCSPVSAKRPAVNEEVRLFRSRHRDRPVIPVIIEGIYPENFPPALRYEIDPDGTLSSRPQIILGSDLRESGDGQSLGLAKIVAGLTGVSTDEIVKRAERDRRRTLRNWVAGLSLVVLALAGLSVWAEFNRREAVAQRTIAERNFAAAKQTVNGHVIDIATGLQAVEGMRAASILKILRTAERTVNDLVRTAPDNPDLQRTRAGMLMKFGDVYAATGAPGSLESYEESLAIFRKLAAADEGDKSLQYAVSLSLDSVGSVKLRTGDVPGALKAYEESLAIRRKLVAADEGNALWQRAVSRSLDSLGDVKLRAGDVPGALKVYEESLTISRKLTGMDESNTEWRRDLSVSLDRVGNAKVRTGDTPGALRAYEESLTIRRTLAAADSANTEWQRAVSVSLEKLGDVKLRSGDAPGALKSYEEGFAIARILAAADEGNIEWQAALVISHVKIAQAAPDTARRKEALGNALKIVKELRSRGVLSKEQEGWQEEIEVELAK
jgi:tetratricopeptide (TPR) repeat protein